MFENNICKKKINKCVSVVMKQFFKVHESTVFSLQTEHFSGQLPHVHSFLSPCWQISHFVRPFLSHTTLGPEPYVSFSGQSLSDQVQAGYSTRFPGWAACMQNCRQTGRRLSLLLRKASWNERSSYFLWKVPHV
jgi:hypothetical protein